MSGDTSQTIPVPSQSNNPLRFTHFKMEELVASLEHNVHVGRQAYDLSTLQVSHSVTCRALHRIADSRTGLNSQNQLSKTLAYSNSYHFANQIPFDTTTPADTRQAFGSDMRYPTMTQATKPTRPMITPTTSFRAGTGGATHQPWSAEGRYSADARQEAHAVTGSKTALAGSEGQHSAMDGVEYQPPPSTTKHDDYSAFEHDAFAPLHTSSSGMNQSTGIPADPWAAFRSRLPSAIGNTNHVQHQERPWMQNTNQQPNTWHHQGFVGSAYQKH